MESLNLDSYFFVPPHSPGAGGLALFWKSDISLQVLSSDQNYIDTLIFYKEARFNSTFVYGAPNTIKSKEVWQLLTDISRTKDDFPWFLTGDFSEITDNSEISGGKKNARRAHLLTSGVFSPLVICLTSSIPKTSVLER